ncbi:MAG: lipid IV(A) 3-deoxy-D-manno-octulosonic acid transferase [Betaproteobacteria bacterium]|nr:lipid IV(A) 3-deoxy-D-manno-octulosonic acid transferase [Betaproteobacteria bacterium]
MLTTRARYAVIAWLLLPFAFLRLLWRSRRLPAYRRHWAERLGRYPIAPPPPLIWLHAVSVGETRAAVPLIRELRRRYPGYRLLLTHMTPTGRETATDLIGPDVYRCYLPFDLPFAVDRFLGHFRPTLGLLLETEIWPHLVAACRQRNIPLLLVNARLSEKSAARYALHQPLVRETLKQLTLVAAQTPADSARFTTLGAPQVTVAGNLKFDMAVSQASETQVDSLRRLVGEGRRIWLAASTRPGEEQLLLDLWPALDAPDRLFILVPRHPQRFDEVAALLRRLAIPFVRRSENRPMPAGTRVLLGDSMGELQAYYQVADVAVIGGSLLPFGGQNLIEATAVGCPVILGPHTYNFQEAADAAVTAGAAIRLTDAARLPQILPPLLEDGARRQAMGEAGRRFTLQHQGAVHNLLALIERFVAAKS